MSQKRLINIALVLSLGVNLLFVGAILGRIVFDRGHRPAPMEWILRNLDEPTREKIHANMKAQTAVVQPLREEMRAARKEFNDLLDQPELDDEALRASLERLHKVAGEYQSTLQTNMVAILKELPPDQRRRVSRMLMFPRGFQPGERPPHKP